MKDFNDVIANMSEKELDMAIKEQDNKALQVISEAVTQQQEVALGHEKLITALEKTLYQVVEVFQQDRKETRAKLEVLAASLDRLEVQLGNRPEGTRKKPNQESGLQGIVDKTSRSVTSPSYAPDVKPPIQPSQESELQEIINETIAVSEAKEEAEREIAKMEEILGLDEDELNELKKMIDEAELNKEEDIDERD